MQNKPLSPLRTIVLIPLPCIAINFCFEFFIREIDFDTVIIIHLPPVHDVSEPVYGGLPEVALDPGKDHG